MLEFYPQIKLLHIACVLASGALFMARGALIQSGRDGVAQWLPVRWLSYAIDTTLLTAALMLVAMLPHGLYANGWLTVKLALLVAYVALGVLALRRSRTPRLRTLCYVAALATYLYMLGVARMHHPLGWFHGWMT